MRVFSRKTNCAIVLMMLFVNVSTRSKSSTQISEEIKTKDTISENSK